MIEGAAPHVPVLIDEVVAALGPVRAMRMSSGPSARKEKPRSAWSICIDDTPMSRTTPSTALAWASSVENGAWTRRSRPFEPASSSRPAAIASGSRSMAMTDASARRSARV
jgi:hypothetical protein